LPRPRRRNRCPPAPAGHECVPANRELLGEHVGNDVDVPADLVAGRLSEDRADRRGDHLGVTLAHLRKSVAHEVHPASLPGGALQDGADGVGQPAVAVADDQAAHPSAQRHRQRQPGHRGRLGDPGRPATQQHILRRCDGQRSTGSRWRYGWNCNGVSRPGRSLQEAQSPDEGPHGLQMTKSAYVHSHDDAGTARQRGGVLVPVVRRNGASPSYAAGAPGWLMLAASRSVVAGPAGAREPRRRR
jgi:hypothetical protein